MTPGRCTTAEIADLRPGMDFRLPQYRREVFMRFYEFHLRYGTNPGCVYFLLPWLGEHLGLSVEQQYWMAFINGNTQNPVTTYIILREFPEPRLQHLKEWFDANYHRLEFDIDRRYQKGKFVEAVISYVNVKCTFQTQRDYFARVAEAGWAATWRTVSKFAHFGRLSTWSYLEYLKIIGLPLEPDDLMLRDKQGSRSHRNGLCKVLGRDDLDWHESNPGFNGYSPEVLEWLEAEAVTLKAELTSRLGDRVSNLTLESALCTYKSWHRPNRRYPNVYADMLHGRIQRAERLWPEIDFKPFWEARASHLPRYLRLECNPADPGLCSEKQNYYRLHGCPVMMHRDWPCFKNDFNSRIDKVQKISPRG